MSNDNILVEIIQDFESIDVSTFVSTDHNGTGFFLEECAEECNKLRLNLTHFCVQKGTKNLLAFITVSASKMITYRFSPRDSFEGKRNTELYDHWPVIKIENIAVTKEYQRRKIGSNVVRAIIRIVEKEICNRVGCRFIIVEAYNQEDNTEFFRSLGFKKIPPKSIHSKSRRKEKSGKSIVLMIYNLEHESNIQMIQFDNLQ